ncbi:hypothetical protein EB796_020116 [Bugula neritina]|uniref:C2H2-type domain-containing protein n=1 Tax=Bugula neritina TaxID=10212 RepID=A0A7J7J750_BUGNE|nr:hypothetical protein EB796_020116 [Bugula neritina]
MPVTTRRHAASTETTTTGDQGDCPLEQCGNLKCNTRQEKRLSMMRIDKYSEWKNEQPWLCPVFGYYQCVICKSTYAKLTGLSQHLRSQTERYHHEKSKTGARKVRWTNGMLIQLTREEVQLEQEGRYNINIRLQERFSEHTIESIKGNEREREQNKELTGVSPSHDEQEDYRNDLREAINKTHTSGNENYLPLELTQEHLDKTFIERFPLLTQQVTQKKNNPEETPAGKNQARRRMYGKAQQLYRKNPGRLMDQILLDSLGQSSPPPDETMPRCNECHPQLNELLAPIVAHEVEQPLAVKNKGASGPDGYTWKK